MLNEIEQAFGQHLAGMAGVLPIVWPNKTRNGTKPYLDVQHVPTSNDTPGLAGGGEVQRGYFVATVVITSNQFSKAANTQADLIKARFAKGTTLTAGTRKMRILNTPQYLPPFADEADWRQPVRIEYIVTAR
jgi:hypothetical protein